MSARPGGLLMLNDLATGPTTPGRNISLTAVQREGTVTNSSIYRSGRSLRCNANQIKVYHDFYWVDARPNTPWPKLDPQAVLSEIARVVKPGGVLLLVDHSAKAGTGSNDAGRLHRIAESYARSDFEKHGFQYVATTDVLHQPNDDRGPG